MSDTTPPYPPADYSYPTPPPLPEPPVAEPPPEPAPWPEGFWAGLDHMLHHAADLPEFIRRDEELGRLTKLLFSVSIAMAAIYGAVMGATNLLQAQDASALAKGAQPLISAAKVPALFLLTLLIIFPPVYVSNAFVGAKLLFRQLLALLLCSIAITVTVLASMASVAFFFALTTRTYELMVLLHVAFFSYAGVVGLGYLVKANQLLQARRSGRQTPQLLFLLWLTLYAFVGTQLGWSLRPFIGSPSQEFSLFREREGNFYESVLQAWSGLVER